MSRPRRRRTSEARRPQFLVFTEGEKTEPQYLTHWRRRFRDQVIVEIDSFHGTPRSLVDRAVERKKQEVRNAKRGRGDPFDQIWVVFDTDEHPDICEAERLAAEHGIGVARSNPCIELWFQLHFEDQTAWIHRHVTQARCRELLSCEKSLSASAMETLAQRYEEARARAAALDRKHEADGSPSGENPSSSMWRLIDQIVDA